MPLERNEPSFDSTRLEPRDMTRYSAAGLLGGLIQFAMQLNATLLGVACILFLCSTVLVIWRLWAFTIKPALHPDEPKGLPYWIPCEYSSFVTTIHLVSLTITVDLGRLPSSHNLCVA